VSRHSANSPHVVSQLAKRIAGRGSTPEHAVERWQVSSTSPLLIEEIEGDLVLEDGDPDFTIGVALRQHIATYGIAVGDMMLVVRSGNEWHAFDAVTAIEPSKRAAG
jgi:hypothetical protein